MKKNRKGMKMIGRFLKRAPINKENVRLYSYMIISAYALFIGVNTFIKNVNTPPFENADTVLKVLINNPHILSMLSTLITIILGVGIYSLLVSKGLTKFSIGNSGFELEQEKAEIAKAENHIDFGATILQNRHFTMNEIAQSGDVSFDSTLKFILSEYQERINVQHNAKVMNFEIHHNESHLTKKEVKMLDSVRNNKFDNVAYSNGIMNENNHLVGHYQSSITEEELIIVITFYGDMTITDSDKKSVEEVFYITDTLLELMYFMAK